MTRALQIAAALALTLFTTTTHAQYGAGAPPIEGRYNTYSSESCTIIQSGNSVRLLSEQPGVSQFEFQGAHGIRRFAVQNLLVEQHGFHGQFQISFADGRPSVAGHASLFSADKPGDWQVAFFRLESGVFRKVDSRMITRIGPIGVKPASGGLAAVPEQVNAQYHQSVVNGVPVQQMPGHVDPVLTSPRYTVPRHHAPVQQAAPKTKQRNDQFNLLPASNLDDLGI